jgi:hypothetical protein
MGPRIRNHIRSNVVGYVALFFALSGGAAYALDGSNTVFSDDLVDDQVRSVDVRNDSLTGGGLAPADLRPGAVGTSEVANNSLGGVDIANDAVNSAKVADESLTGGDVAESTLGQVPSAALGGIGRSAFSGQCDPEGVAFLSCAFSTIVLPAPSRILVIGSVKAQPEPGADLGTGQCRLATNNGTITTSGLHAVGRSYNDKFVPLMGITDAGPGPLDFGIECNELSDYLTFYDAHVIAVALSSS